MITATKFLVPGAALVIALVGNLVVSFSIRAAALSSGPCGKDDCSIAVTQIDANNDRVDITRPVVTQESFRYNKVVFMPGDQILVNAGGCVQRGGHGLTWYRYVNPTKPDNLYFGSLEIPGVLATRRFSDLIGSTIAVPAGNPTALVLHYADDGYGDNGYYSPDPGPDNQCAGADHGPAHITLKVLHGVVGAPPPPPLQPSVPQASLSWDLTQLIQSNTSPLIQQASPLDDNGFLLNPRWVWQRLDGEQPIFNDFSPGVLSSQITGTDSPKSRPLPKLCASDLGVGHVNWFDVTYTGTVHWAGHSCGRPGDDDYNIDITPRTANGIPISVNVVDGKLIVAGGTKDNPDSIEGEFTAHETIDLFGKSTWWQKFHDAVDRDRKNLNAAQGALAGAGAGAGAGAVDLLGPLGGALAGALFGAVTPICNQFDSSASGVDSNGGSRIDPPFIGIEGHDAIMTGLMGLDTVHGAKSEIHPVHALAIREAIGFRNPTDDAWAVFARNWGDEGQCSHNQHFAIRGIDLVDVNNPVKSIAIRIPRPLGVPPSGTAKFGPGTAIFKPKSLNMGGHCDPQTGEGCDFVISQVADGAVITFRLNTPTARSFQFGELHLVWDPPLLAARDNPRLAATTAGATLAQAANGDQNTSDREPPDQESVDLLSQFYSLDPAARDAINQRIEAASPPQIDTSEPASGGIMTGEPLRTDIGQVIFDAPDEDETRIRDVAFGGICEATHGVTPLIPGFCLTLNVAHIEAETFVTQSGGIKILESETDSGSGVIKVRNGDWVHYAQINFGDGSLNTFVANMVARQAGDRVEVRLDDLNGTKIAALKTERTPKDSSESTTYMEQTAPMMSVVGVHDIFILFKEGYYRNEEDNRVGRSNIGNFDWFGLRHTDFKSQVQQSR